MSEKDFLDYNEQIIEICSKKIQIDDRSKAKKFLIDEGMYNIVNRYKDPFLFSNNPEIFERGTTFYELVVLQKFDSALRHFFSFPLTSIERKIKAAMAFELSKKYGKCHEDYLSIKNFNTSSPKYLSMSQNLISTLFSIISKNTSARYPSSIKHYMTKYQFVPLWVFMNALTLGQVSKYYSCLNPTDQHSISRRFRLSAKELDSILAFLCIIRNKCAHYDRLYSHKKDSNSKYPLPVLLVHKKMNIPVKKDKLLFGTNDMLGFVIIAKYFCEKREYQRFVKSLIIQCRWLSLSLSPNAYTKITDTTGLKLSYLNSLLKI